MDIFIKTEVSIAIEFKVIRLRANGSVEPAIFKHILSPFPDDRSAVHDVNNVTRFDADHNVVGLIVFHYDTWDSNLLVDSFRHIVRSTSEVDEYRASFSGLVHKIHQQGEIVLFRIGSKVE